MMTESEYRRLGVQMHRELKTGPAIVWKCAVGLLVLSGLALAGNWFDLIGNRAVEVAKVQAGQAAPPHGGNQQRQDIARPAAGLPVEVSHNPAPAAGSSQTPAR